MKHVWMSYDGKAGKALCDIADEVERVFGFGICIVTVGKPCGLYIDDRFPTWKKAFDYARELVDDAKEAAQDAALQMKYDTEHSPTAWEPIGDLEP